MVAGLIPPAVYVADSRGITQVIRTAHLIGINSLDENNYNLDILERGSSISVLDATYAYSVFASMGIQRGVDVEPLAQGIEDAIQLRFCGLRMRMAISYGSITKIVVASAKRSFLNRV